MFIQSVHIALLGALLLAGCAAQPAQKSSAPQPMRKVSSEPTPAQPQSSLICTVEKRTGSHMPTRTCMTSEQREQRSQQDQDALLKRQNRGSASTPSGS